MSCRGRPLFLHGYQVSGIGFQLRKLPGLAQVLVTELINEDPSLKSWQVDFTATDLVVTQQIQAVDRIDLVTAEGSAASFDIRSRRDDDNWMYRELPLLNESLADTLGSGTIDVLSLIHI